VTIINQCVSQKNTRLGGPPDCIFQGEHLHCGLLFCVSTFSTNAISTVSVQKRL